MKFRQVLALVVFQAMIIMPLPARAQESTNEAIAEALFREGQELMRKKNIHRACEKFAASQQLEYAIGTLLNLAVCHESDGKSALAWAEYAEVVSKASQANDKDRLKFAQERQKALEPILARAIISVANGEPVLDVKLDGKTLPAAAWNSPIPVDPGKHLLEVGAPNKKPWTTVFISKPKATESIEVPSLENLPQEKTTAAKISETREKPLALEPTTSRPGVSRRRLGYVLDASGGALLVTGGIMAYVTSQTAKEARETTDLDEWNKLKSKGKTQQIITGICLGAGLAALGTGLYFTFTHPRDNHQSTALTAAPLPGGASVLVVGSF